MELKTLKDLKENTIKNHTHEIDDCCREDGINEFYSELCRILTEDKEFLTIPEKIFDINIIRIKELIDLFKEKDFDIKKDEDWKEIKRHFFNLTEEDLK